MDAEGADFDLQETVTESVQDDELQVLLESEGLKVWGQHQKVLENQAFLHLQTLQAAQDAEDGEIPTDGEPKEPEPGGNAIAGITKYIENQALLHKTFVDNKRNSVSEKSRQVANKISSQQTQRPTCSKSIGPHKRKKEDVVEKSNDSDSEYVPSDCDSGSDYSPRKKVRASGPRKRKQPQKESVGGGDDSLPANYKHRLEAYEQECAVETEGKRDCKLSGGLMVPGKIWHNLYSYQQEGVRWLWSVHRADAGGLLGDEMGLGKTVQIIAFLAALDYSNVKQQRYEGLGPTLVVCPATVIHQWLKHFHTWWPPFRVVLLHQSSHYAGDRLQLIKDVNKSNGIIVTTYESVLKYKAPLVALRWNYIILDEGHKIRNPNAKITVVVKQFRTPHRLLLTGSPMQNNLQELWSLFDFIVPGKLGTLQVFQDHFASPITQGGFVNATPTQETTALLIAQSLKDMISPHMLRRSKEEVRDCIFLPNKSEQVLFCSLTDEQRDLYKGYLLSDHVGGLLGRVRAAGFSDNQKRANILVGITTLRKICNHPDLYLGAADEPFAEAATEIPEENQFGFYKRSGKMVVVAALLKIWKRQGHRVLLFTQSRAMVQMFEQFLTQHEYKYLKMDGSTSVASRQPLINTFNQDGSFDVFLLTTRVGGLGVNLTGANRVVIFDPDWNPATDTQARERAWRIGQLKQVTIYRLVSAGTIEEKMYQRQVWKQLLSNKVLLEPGTQKFFRSSDLTELFSLQEHTDTNPETANIFRNSKIDVRKRKTRVKDSEVTFSDDKIQAMKDLAQQISKNIGGPGAAMEKEPVVARPTPAELLVINRKKLEVKVEPEGNKMDDQETDDSFSAALSLAERKYVELRTGGGPKEKPPEPAQNKKKPKTDGGVRGKIDNSGQIDGLKVEGLVKREVKKPEAESKRPGANQDQYVLEKLFSKKGVHTALQHDVVVQSGRRENNNLKVHYEAQLRADKALQAIRKSRLNSWRW